MCAEARPGSPRVAGAGASIAWSLAWCSAVYVGACATNMRPVATSNEATSNHAPSTHVAPTASSNDATPVATSNNAEPPLGPSSAAGLVRASAASGRVWNIALDDADGAHGLSGFAPRSEGRFGLDRLHLESADDGSHAPVGETGALGPSAPRSFLRADFPRGSASPAVGRATGAPGGGAQFLGTRPGTPADHLFLRYRVRFAENFAFVKGGKLPGFYGGRMISGGRIPDGTDGFSTRFMWRAGGAGEVYAYLPSSQTWGTSLGRGSFHFVPGRWQCLEQELSLNTPGRADGFVRVWLDDQPVFAQEQLTFRTTAALRIEGVFFSTFFGGNDPSWASPVDTHADFANFAVAERRIGCAGR